MAVSRVSGVSKVKRWGNVVMAAILTAGLLIPFEAASAIGEELTGGVLQLQQNREAALMRRHTTQKMPQRSLKTK